MTDYPTLKNAPITEALLDIQVVSSPGVDLATLATIQNSVFDRYPKRQERTHWEIQAAEIDTASPLISQRGGVVGYLFFPAKEPADRVLQSRLDGFTFSKLRPYDTWKSFRDEARDLWQIYAEVAQPTWIKRLSLRTINSLNLPLPFVDFKEYLLTIPEVAPGIPSALSTFFMQLNIPQPDGEVAVVTSAMRPMQQLDDKVVNVIFDIDVFSEQPFSPDSSAIWEVYENLRRIRNDIFFSSLTDKAKELF